MNGTGHGVETCGCNSMTSVDCIVGSNITPFGQCKSTLHPSVIAGKKSGDGFPCKPDLTDEWLSPGTTIINGSPIITLNSFLPCFYADDMESIIPLDTGQGAVSMLLSQTSDKGGLLEALEAQLGKDLSLIYFIKRTIIVNNLT